VGRAVKALAVAIVAAGALAATGQAAAQAPDWAPADTATVHPGVQTVTDGGQCTANFVFFDAADIYVGQAAHCAGTGAATDTNGCDAGSLPLGTPVEVDGASQPGTLAYSSWIAMQQAGESDANACDYNDFALVRLNPADHGKVNPSIPFWGGPTGVVGTTTNGAKVLSYGNSSLRGGIEQLSPKEGVSLGQSGGGWSHSVFTASPGIPGDSGSAFIDAQGRAFGVLATLQIAPLAGSNGVGDVSREVAYMRSHGGPQAELAPGTEPFRGPLLPLP
jgi:hypothetical protein